MKIVNKTLFTHIFLVLPLIFKTQIINAQNNSKIDSDKNNFISLVINPAFSKDLYGDFAQLQIVERFPVFNINYGIEFTKKINKSKNWYLSSSLMFCNYSFDEKLLNNSITMNEFMSKRYSNKFLTFSITPLRYFKRYYVGFGINYSRFISRSETSNENTIRYSEPLAKGYHRINEWMDNWLFGFQSRIGMKIKFNERFLVRTELNANTTQAIGDYAYWFPIGFKGRQGFYNYGFSFFLDYSF